MPLRRIWKPWAAWALASTILSGCAAPTSPTLTSVSEQLLSPPSVPMPARPNEILERWNKSVTDSRTRLCERQRLLGPTETPCKPDATPSPASAKP